MSFDYLNDLNTEQQRLVHQNGQVSALRRFPSAPGAPVGKALPGRYALRNGRKLMAKLNINGKMRDVRVEADTPLLWVIREHVGLTGTKYGCGIAPVSYTHLTLPTIYSV